MTMSVMQDRRRGNTFLLLFYFCFRTNITKFSPEVIQISMSPLSRSTIMVYLNDLFEKARSTNILSKPKQASLQLSYHIVSHILLKYYIVV